MPQVKDLGINKLIAELEKLNATKVTVGVQGKEATQRHPDGDGATIGEIAAWHEFGTDNMDPRPFVRVGLSLYQDEIQRANAQATSNLVDGRFATADDAIEHVGHVMRESIVATIDRAAEWAEPLAKSTEQAKDGPGILRETDAMRDAVTWAERRGSAIVRQGK